MVVCRTCGGNIPDDGRFCPYCGNRQSILITNYDLSPSFENKVHLTSGSISLYVTSGAITVDSAGRYPDSAFLNFGANEFKNKLNDIPEEFAQKIEEGEEAVARYDKEIKRRNRAGDITTLIGNTNAAFQGKKNAALFREDDQRVITDFHSPCETEADFVSKIARVVALFEVPLGPLRNLVDEPGDLRSIRLVEKWLQDSNIQYDPDMIQTWINLVDLRNMRPLHRNLDPARLNEITNFFGTTLPPNYHTFWDGILDIFMKSLLEWQKILKEL